eukprot:CAMPEP_0113453542 /NCGR_PEP_ID=MMETSP0014_2-20120614/7408_1 /TAXON_ID=2857 /ORGANISM="Nitzschia sp." /LENGTH=251 /DNA_ID=CAMNT_0000344933 /DNA_START=127 /DNA_END=882 /DNA_ORIENTATION=+ /assembly_acc=CAM_ASM_000159
MMFQSSTTRASSMAVLFLSVLFGLATFSMFGVIDTVSGQEIEAVDFLVTTDYTNSTDEDQHFIARIYDPEIIAIARGEIEKVEPPFMIIAGTIVKETADWNPDWSFYIDPATVIFGDVFVEVCDANVEFVEENLDDAGGAFLPSNFWCPWSSRVLEEVGNETVVLTMEPSMVPGSEVPSDVPSLIPSVAPSPAPSDGLQFTLPPVPPESTPPTESPAPSSAVSLLSSSSSWTAVVSSIMIVVGVTAMVGLL